MEPSRLYLQSFPQKMANDRREFPKFLPLISIGQSPTSDKSLKFTACVSVAFVESMTIRAVHLEMAYSMSTDSFISALRKFVFRRKNVAHRRNNRKHE